MLGAAARFALTGGLATLTHLAVALLLIRMGVAPLISNAVAFAFAFTVSFWGHHLFSFAGHGTAPRRAFPRFLLVSCLGFGINEAILLAILQFVPDHASVALLISTGCAAGATFVLSRHWAFRRQVSVQTASF